MPSFKLWAFITLLLFLNSLLALPPETSEQESNNVPEPGEAEQRDPSAEDKRSDFRRFPSYLRVLYKRKPGEYYDEMPLTHSRLFETTVCIERYLFYFVVLYGVLHLPFWETLYHRLKRYVEERVERAEDEDLE